MVNSDGDPCPGIFKGFFIIALMSYIEGNGP